MTSLSELSLRKRRRSGERSGRGSRCDAGQRGQSCEPACVKNHDARRTGHDVASLGLRRRKSGMPSSTSRPRFSPRSTPTALASCSVEGEHVASQSRKAADREAFVRWRWAATSITVGVVQGSLGEWGEAGDADKNDLAGFACSPEISRVVGVSPTRTVMGVSPIGAFAVSVWVSPTETWHLPPLVFRFREAAAADLRAAHAICSASSTVWMRCHSFVAFARSTWR